MTLLPYLLLFHFIYLSYVILPRQIPPHSYPVSSGPVCPVVDAGVSEAVPNGVLKKEVALFTFALTYLFQNLSKLLIPG